MENTLLHIHSVLRYVVLFTALYAIYRSYTGFKGNKDFVKADTKAGTWFVMSVHTQFIIGIFDYIYSPIIATFLQEPKMGMKDSYIRFFAMEHVLVMLIAVVLITIGKSKSKRAATDRAKHKKAFTFYLIGLLLILVSIPWPFIAKYSSRAWF